MDPLDELTSREPVFYRPAPGTDVASMLTDDFWEVGASGRVYDREQILAILADRMRNPPEDHWETGDVRCQELAPDVYLLTYALRRGGRHTRRSSIWRRTAGGWRMQFHQGTEVPGQ